MKTLHWITIAVVCVLGANLEAQTNNQIFYLDVNNTINRLSTTNGTTWVNQSLGQLATGSTRLTSFTDNLGSHVFYQSGSLQINQLLGTGSSSGITWTNSALPGAGSGGTGLTSFVDRVGEHVFFRDINGGVNQLLGTITSTGVTWSSGIVPNSTGATGATGLTSFTDSAGEHLFYVDFNDQVIHMLGTVSSTGSVTWGSPQNLTALGHGTSTSGSTALTSLTDSAGTHVFYQDFNNQLNQLSSAPGSGTWTNQVLNSFGAIAGGTPLTSFADNTGENVFYLDINQAVNRISSPTGVTWTHQNLGFTAAGAAGLTSFSDGAGEHVVYVGSALSVNHLSSSSGGTSWTNQNIPSGTSGSSALGSTQAPLVSRFVAVTPCRVADTRLANGPFGGPFLAANASRGFAIPSSTCGIPSNAQAYAVNLTVIPRGVLGFLTAYPCGQTLPLSSNLNSPDGRTKAVAAIVPAGTNGAVCAFPSGDTDFVLDISGYFVPATTSGALAFFPLTPCRIADTRNAVGPLGGPSLVANTTRAFPVLSSSCGIPSTAQAYSLNFTAIPQGVLGFLTAWPAGQSQPVVSTLNAVTGVTTANAAIVRAGTSGSINVVASSASDLAIDINGYFAPPGTGGLSLFSLTPCRVLDTRTSGTPINGAATVPVTTSGCGAPASAQAYLLNATAIPTASAPLGFLTLWPNGAPQPGVSTLNAVDGAIASNLAIVPTTNGSINAFSSSSTDLVLDIFGYFAP